MQELRDFYRGSLKVMAIGMGFLAVLVRYLIVLLEKRFGEEDLLAQILGVLTSGGVIGLLFLIGEYLLRTRIWRVCKRSLDYGGSWNGTTTYTRLERGAPDVGPEDHQPFDAQHQVRIVQDCLSLRLAPAEGDEFVNWRSLTMDLDRDHNLCYAYAVSYTGRPRFPASAIGYEEMFPVEHDSKGRPVKLRGTFSHCIAGEGPRYSGIVEFTRVSSPPWWKRLLRRSGGVANKEPLRATGTREAPDASPDR